MPSWQFPHSPPPPGQSLLPPPNHAIPSPTLPTPLYEARPYDTPSSRNDYNQGWSRETLPAVQHHFQSSYHPSRPDVDTRSHESHNYIHRESTSQTPVTLPIPSSALPSANYNGRFSHATRLPEMTPRRGSISHPDHTMRYAATSKRYQTAETLPGSSHMGYNPTQESRQASRPERQNGNAYEEQQHWPPPAPGFLAAPEQYGSMGYQGFNR